MDNCILDLPSSLFVNDLEKFSWRTKAYKYLDSKYEIDFDIFCLLNDDRLADVQVNNEKYKAKFILQNGRIIEKKLISKKIPQPAP